MRFRLFPKRGSDHISLNSKNHGEQATGAVLENSWENLRSIYRSLNPRFRGLENYQMLSQSFICLMSSEISGESSINTEKIMRMEKHSESTGSDFGKI